MTASVPTPLVITVKSSTLVSMKHLLPLFLLVVSASVLAESGAYRVEIILFRNLLATNESAETPELRNFSQFPNLELSIPDDNLSAGPDQDLAKRSHGGFPDGFRHDLPD
ncbi:MAG: hypothetical protein OEU84_14135, partial [Xanthomonadales bacterium]|nr:hypothetical protein [Xanthomonadales bacterium]